MKHSVRSLYDAAGVSIVGSVAYLSNKRLPNPELGKLSKWLPEQPWFRKVVSNVTDQYPVTGGRIAGWLGLSLLSSAMKERDIWHNPSDDPFKWIHPEHEPEWLKHLPPSARRFLRCEFAMSEGIEPLGIVPVFPYIGFGYIQPDYGMASDAAQVFGLHRLNQVKQLGFLHNPIGKSSDRSLCSTMFDHTRYCHSLDVHAVANIIAANLGIKGVDLNTLLTAAITHDALTPAGGDSIKLVDPEAFNEDIHYPELLAGQKWEYYRHKYQIDRELLVKTIGGEGLLGRILDIADKSSYLARDVNAYLGGVAQKNYVDTGYATIASIVKDDPFVCAIWEDARLDKGQLVFRNAERIARFLILRALMFRELYYNPYSRFFEYMVGKGVVKYLYTNKLITRKELLENGDWWIEKKIDEVLGTHYSFLGIFHDLRNARIEEHQDHDSAMRRLVEFDEDDSVIVILDDFNSSTSPSTKKFLVRKDGRTLSFRVACPVEAEQIESIMRFSERVRLYFFMADDLKIPTKNRKRLKEIMRSVT